MSNGLTEDLVRRIVREEIAPLRNLLTGLGERLDKFAKARPVSSTAEIVEHKGAIWKVGRDKKSLETEAYCPMCYHKDGSLIPFSTPDPFYAPTCTNCAFSAPFQAHDIEKSRKEALEKIGG